jgi:hypothetical protein
MTTKQALDNNKCWQDTDKLESSWTSGGNVQEVPELKDNLAVTENDYM